MLVSCSGIIINTSPPTSNHSQCFNKLFHLFFFFFLIYYYWFNLTNKKRLDCALSCYKAHKEVTRARKKCWGKHEPIDECSPLHSLHVFFAYMPCQKKWKDWQLFLVYGMTWQFDGSTSETNKVKEWIIHPHA